MLERLNKAFLQAEDQMTGALEFRKAEVKVSRLLVKVINAELKKNKKLKLLLINLIHRG